MSGSLAMRSNTSEILYKNGTFVASNSGDSFTKVADAISVSEGGNSGLDKLGSDRLSHLQYSDVRFTPNALEFFDAFQGKQYCEKLVIQNVGRNPVIIRIGEPTSFIFQLKKPSRRNIFLAAGASITRTITYTFHNNDLVQKSRIPIYINGRRIDYPIMVKKAKPELEVDPPKIDFGTINLGSEVKTLILTISNAGGTRSKFEIDIGKNDLDLVVNPMRGTVKAKHSVKVSVEILGMKEGDFYRELWIKTNEIPIRVPVLVEVVRPRLLVVFPNGTEEFSAIDFPPTFDGTQRAVPFVLKNCGGETALFITAVEVNGEHQFINEARKTHEIFRFFSLTAEEGRLESHEARVLTALFRPVQVKKTKGWHHQEKMERKPQSEYIVFLTMSRVHCIERKEIEKVYTPFYQLENSKNTMNLRIKKEASRFEAISEHITRELMNQSNFKEKEFRLCLRGKSVRPEVLIQPSKIDFEKMNLGETKQRVLTVTNKSIIRVKCVFEKKMNVDVLPKEFWIGAEKMHEFTVRVTPSCPGTFNHTLKVEFFGESDVVYATDEPIRIVTKASVIISFTGITPKKLPMPKIGLGITPLITDEVGMNKDLVTFQNTKQVPYAAKLLSQKEEFKPNWMKINPIDARTDTMALPNDRQRGFQTWPKDQMCRTIFKGWLRYAPPKDPLYTFPSEELLLKNENKAVWTNYLLLMREIRKGYKEKPEMCDEILIPNCLRKIKGQLCSTEEQFKTSLTFVKKSACYNLQKCLVPLSPMYLSCVIVEPKMINFGMVAVNHSVGAELTIKNQNIFPIAIKFVPRNSAVSVNESAITVHPNSEKTIKVFFQLNILGRYYGFLNYVINGSHEFKITISAFVMSRTVVIERKSLLFCNYPQDQAFQPRTMFVPLENWLQAPIRYKFEFSTDSPYFAMLEEGEIPPRSKMQSEIVFGAHPKKPLSAEMKITSESGNKEMMKISQIYRKLPVGFLTNRIELKDIPLNLKTKVTPIVENECFHDVTFEVINGTPIPGVTVQPISGIIKSRSFFPLNVQIQIPVAMRFTFDIHMIIQTSNNICVKISGNVVLPVIRITPPAINMRKICAQSFDTVMICIANIGTTPSEIDIDFRACPEYSVLDNKSHLYLRPKQSTSIVIKFEPNDVARYIFYLPIIINKILGPPMMQESDTEKVSFFLSDLTRLYDVYGDVYDTDKWQEKVPLAILSCTVSSSLLSVSPSAIDFNAIKGDKTSFTLHESVSSKILVEKSGLGFWQKTIVMVNENTKIVTFCIRNDDLGKDNDSPFDLQPVDRENVEYRLKSMKITLAPGQQIEFLATFSPKKPGKYKVQVPIYVRGYNNGVVYCYITLKGKVDKPSLIPEAQEIHFSPVPLNVSTELKFTITAENYSKANFISCLICDAKETDSLASQTLKTLWVQPPEVTEFYNRQNFTIYIAFKSAIPVALRCYLVFVDSERNYCSVLLTAIADNSSLTTHWFLFSKIQRYKLIRSDCTPLVWKADDHPVLFYPFDKNYLNDLYKAEKPEKKSDETCIEGNDSTTGSNHCTKAIDRGPSLVVQGSATRSNVGLVTWNRKEESVMGLPLPFTSVISLGNRVKSSQSKGNEIIDTTYPNYPTRDGLYKKYCDTTLLYVERWIYEVVMRCDQYFMIPWSFQVSKKCMKQPVRGNVRQEKDVINFLEEIFGEQLIRRFHTTETPEPPFRWVSRLVRFYTDLLRMLESQGCFLPHIRPEFLLPYDDYCLYIQSIKNVDIARPITEPRTNISEKLSFNILNINKKSELNNTMVHKTTSCLSNKDWCSAKSVFDTLSSQLDVECSLEKQENLELPDILAIDSRSKQKEFVALPSSEEFQHKHEILDEVSFTQRSTQAWLDVVIQIFRHGVLRKIVYKSTIPAIRVIGPGERLPIQSLEMMKVLFYGEGKAEMVQSESNSLYNIQERTLLLWLNHHLNVQRELMWRNAALPKDKIINNFHKDLADSLALMSVTASYCPFVVPEYFRDCFSKPDTPVKLHHNAARLVQAWRELSIGLTVETTDIIKPNNIFLLMLVAQLYEVLPSMHPQYLVSFEAPLSSQHTRKILVQCDIGKLLYQVKILGEDSKYFKLSQESLVEVKEGRVKELKVTFYARKIKKMKATLLFSGCEESPHFGKTLTIFLEGQLSELTESEKLSFSAPLYKVICTEIPIKPLYSDVETYEIWYSTVKPTLSETSELLYSNPWSKLRFRKLCRRLFLNQNEVTLAQGQKNLLLNVTVACFTNKERLFWLLFRSKTRDFIVRVKIKSKAEKVPFQVLKCWFPDARMECLCVQTDKGPRTNWADMRSCPLLTLIKLPSRNDMLWKALQMMFLKSVLPQEKIFWEEYFEKDIGLCIIQWLLSSDEEEEVVDEFLPLLQTRIMYTFSVLDMKKTIRFPPHIEIKDARDNMDVVIPIHIDKGSPDDVIIEMVSESKMEVRLFKIQNEGEEEEKKEITINLNEIHHLPLTPAAVPCKRKNSKSFARLY